MDVAMKWDTGDLGDMRSQLSDVPEAATWREGIVIERARGTGVVLVGENKLGFTSGNLLRNGTFWDNTKIGMRVWVTERGGISAHPPSLFSPREHYDAMLRERARTLANSIDAQAMEEIFS